MSDAKFKIIRSGDASPFSDAGFDAVSGETLQLQLEASPAADVRSCTFAISLLSPGAPSPTIAALGVASPVTATVDLTMPATPLEGAAYAIDCIVNNGEGVIVNGVNDFSVNRKRRIIALKNGLGLAPIIAGERGEYDPTNGWAVRIRDLILAVSGGASGNNAPLARVALLVNIDVLANVGSFNGVSMNVGDRVLLTAQTTGSENGLWIVRFNGSHNKLVRDAWMPTGGSIPTGTIVYVGPEATSGQLGSALSPDTVWELKTTGSIIIGTTPLRFEQIGFKPLDESRILAASSFKPLSIGSMVLWLPADQLALGDAGATLSDKSGSGNDFTAIATHATVIASKQSLHQLSPVGAPVVDFTAGAPYSRSSALTGALGWTLFAVYATKIGTGTTNQSLFAVGSGADGYQAPNLNGINRAINVNGVGIATDDYMSGALSFGGGFGADFATPAWELLTLTADAGPTWTMRVNGNARALSAQYTPSAPSATTYLGGSATPYNWQGLLAELGVYGFIVPAGQVALIERYLARKWALDLPAVWFEGNSLIKASLTTDPTLNAPGAVAAGLLGLLPSQWTNQGIVGITTSQMTTNSPRVTGSMISSLRPRNLVVGWEFSNDLAGGASVATAQNNYLAWRDAVLGYRGQPVAVTVLDRGDAGLPGNYTANRNAINAWLRSNWQALGFYALIDVAADATIGPDGAYNNGTYFFGDKIHLTDAGSLIAGQIFAAALSKFF